MTIAGLQKTTLLDFPGKVACTVFLRGCNFRCPFCQNSELLGAGEDEMSEEAFFGKQSHDKQSDSEFARFYRIFPKRNRTNRRRVAAAWQRQRLARGVSGAGSNR